MVTPRVLLATLATLALTTTAQQCITTDTATTDNQTTFASSTTTTVLVTSPDSDPSTHRLAQSLATDIRTAVQGSTVKVLNATSLSSLGSKPSDQTWVVLGALDGSALVNEAVNATGVDVGGTRGNWEAWTIEKGMAQGSEIIVVAGADRRGTAYAAYTLSEQMGVSPWYWWADVPPQSHTSLGLTPCSHGSPVVKYRGIFLNDEQPGLTNWANKRFQKGSGPQSTDPLGQSFTVEMYGGLFELLLRLKANMLWPAMWADMFAVAGLPALPGNRTDGHGAAGPNQVLADEMGIIYGTSHQEPMARNTPEWNLETGPWNYTSNKATLDKYWTYGAQRAAPHDTLFTVGMRGNGDLPLPGANVKILEGIVADQREILKAARPGTPIESIPQLWCLYKEVQGYFDDDGLEVPDDVMLLWTDDNWSNIRRVPSESERNRTGGAGLYWHHDYVGNPRDYKWISTINFAKAWEQLNVAQSTGIDRMLMINVGDLKPIEVATEFALHLAYEGTQSLLANGEAAPDPIVWTEAWAQRTFPNLDANKVAYVIQSYNALNGKIKPELLNSTTWSLTMHREAEHVEAEWDHITSLVDQLQANVSDAQYPAFFQLVAFPARASANLNKLYIAAGRSVLHGSQARTSANYWAAQARYHFKCDAELTNEYHALLDYKWDGMMAQPHINYPSLPQGWQQPMRNSLPQVTEMQMDAWPVDGDKGSPGALLSPMRITIQGSKGANPGDNFNNCPDGYNCPPLTLPPLSRYSAQSSRWVDVSSGSWIDFSYTATPNVSWITVTPSSGTVGGNGSADCRVEVSVNWDAVPSNMTSSMLYAGIKFTPTPTEFSNSSTTVLIHVDPSIAPDVASHKGGFVQGEPAYIAMHATNATRMNSTNQAKWSQLPGYGLSGNAMTTLPPTHPNASVGAGPVLEYDFYALPSLAGSSNLWNVTVWLGPYYNYRHGDPFKLALQLDDGTPTVVQPIPLASSAGSEPPDWLSVVAASVRRNTTSLPAIQDNGWHTLKVWSINAGMVLEMVTIGAFPVTSLPPPQSYRV